MTPPAGRPEIGPMITLRLTPEDLHAVGQAAGSTGISRAEWLRRAAADHLALPRQEIVGLVPWLIRQSIDADEIGNLIEKPYKYLAWRAVCELGLDLDDISAIEEPLEDRLYSVDTLTDAVAVLRAMLPLATLAEGATP